MAFQIVSYNSITPTSSLTSRTINVPAGVQDGDMIHVFLIKAGGSSVATITGLTFVEETAMQASGYTSQYMYKKNAAAVDAGVTLTVTTTTALRTSVMVVVTRGQTTTVVPQVSKTTATVTTSKTLPVATAATPLAWLVFYGTNGDNSTLTDLSITPAATKVVQTIDSYTAGAVAGAVWTGGPVAASASYGGQTVARVAPGSVPNSGAWVIGLELIPETTQQTIYPSVTVSNTGWSAVNAGSVNAALADSDDNSYVETGDNPNGSVFIVDFNDVLGVGDITVRTRGQANASSPTITREVALLQNSTVIASRTLTLTTSWTTHTFTLTSGEVATVTDRTALRVRITDTAGA